MERRQDMRKDTKKYQTLVKKYVDNRSSYELRQKNIDDFEKKLEKDEDNLTILTAVLRGSNDDLKDWVKDLVEGKTGPLKILIGLLKEAQHYCEAEMEKYGSILVSDYGDNLDELYREAHP
jgi:hypothetical protein